MIAHWWHSYWAWAGSNIGAMPAEALIGGACTLVISPLLLRAWRRVRRALEAAEASHRIAADLYEHHTGRRHPAAPPDKESEAL